MSSIWKAELPINEGQFLVSMPKGAKFLKIENVYNTPCAYFMVDEKEKVQEPVFFRAVWTGSTFTIDKHYKYVGSVSMLPYVIHYFKEE
jgi:hypothetical protein